MIIGLAVGNIFKPGAGMNIDPSTLDPSKIPGAEHQETGFVHFVSGLIPETLLSAFTPARSCRPCSSPSCSGSR